MDLLAVGSQAPLWWAIHPPEGCSFLHSSIPFFFLVLQVAAGQMSIPSPVLPDTMGVPVPTSH